MVSLRFGTKNSDGERLFGQGSRRVMTPSQARPLDRPAPREVCVGVLAGRRRLHHVDRRRRCRRHQDAVDGGRRR